MSFLLTLLSGLATVIGSLIVFIKNENNKILGNSLSFAAGVMIGVSTFDLIFESFDLISIKYNNFLSIIIELVFINIGIIISYLFGNINFIKSNNNLYKVGIISMIIIIFHNIPEGIITYLTSMNNIKIGIKMSLAIAIHNIPEGISISMPIYYSTKSKSRALLYTFISGFSEFIGALITFLFLSNFITNVILGFIIAIISGLMIGISFLELIKEAKKYTHSYYIWILMGILLMLLNHFLLN